MNKSEAPGDVPEGWHSDNRAPLGDSEMTAVRKLAAELRSQLQTSGDATAQPARNLVLLTGPAGSGKAMAAEVLGRELGVKVMRVDLSQLVSKYIGETEKNLTAVFDRAASSNAILFFDEADALFGKRSEVKDSHDRYANAEANLLIQGARRYRGIVIVARSVREAIGDAGDALELKIPRN